MSSIIFENILLFFEGFVTGLQPSAIKMETFVNALLLNWTIRYAILILQEIKEELI